MNAVLSELLTAIVLAALAALAGWFAAGELGAELMTLATVAFFLMTLSIRSLPHSTP